MEEPISARVATDRFEIENPETLTHQFQQILNFNENANPPPITDNDHDHLVSCRQEKHEEIVNNGEEVEENRDPPVVEEINGGKFEVGDGWNDDGGDVQVDDGWNDKGQVFQEKVEYPQRPGVEDCNFYMRTGVCKFGFICKFNHPQRTRAAIQAVKPRVIKDGDDGSERPMHLMECKYYLSPGGCKYGKACRFSHSREIHAVVPVLEYNFLGLPIRPGEKECPYYMRNGSCKYAANCRFNHPDPTAGSDSPAGHANGEQPPSWPPSRPLNDAAQFSHLPYPPARGVHSQTLQWNQGPIYTQERNFGLSPPFGSHMQSMTQTGFSHFQPQLASEEFPERPGQPECTYFIKTGECKFRSGCKFHHPKDQIVQPSCAMTDTGLPLRPGQSICTHYSSYGICKFGPKCRYDHPPNIQHMAP